jgi:hypothetical protein
MNPGLIISMNLTLIAISAGSFSLSPARGSRSKGDKCLAAAEKIWQLKTLLAEAPQMQASLDF